MLQIESEMSSALEFLLSLVSYVYFKMDAGYIRKYLINMYQFYIFFCHLAENHNRTKCYQYCYVSPYTYSAGHQEYPKFLNHLNFISIFYSSNIIIQ